MTYQVRKTRLEEGDELPTHKENVLCSTPVTAGIGEEYSDETVLEVWYVERTNEEYK